MRLRQLVFHHFYLFKEKHKYIIVVNLQEDSPMKDESPTSHMLVVLESDVDKITRYVETPTLHTI